MNHFYYNPSKKKYSDETQPNEYNEDLKENYKENLCTVETAIPTDVPQPHKFTPISTSLEDYEIIREIGRGQFGTVHEVLQTTTVEGKKVPVRTMAWKIVSYALMETHEVRQLQREVRLCEALDHPNVVKYFGRLMDKRNKRICLAMEHCGGGDLGKYLNMTVRQNNPLSETQILLCCSQLIEALHHCHNRASGAVLHRDIKPQNVLLDSSYTQVKLADFGLAKLLRPQERLATTHVGTPYYMSPEVIARQGYDERSDVWSLGCVLYEMVSGHSPYSEALHYEHLKHLVQTRDPRPLPLGPPYGHKGYSVELTGLIMSMLHRDVCIRPDTTALRNTLLMKYARTLAYKKTAHTLLTRLRRAESHINTLNAQVKELQGDKKDSLAVQLDVEAGTERRPRRRSTSRSTCHLSNSQTAIRTSHRQSHSQPHSQKQNDYIHKDNVAKDYMSNDSYQKDYLQKDYIPRDFIEGRGVFRRSSSEVMLDRVMPCSKIEEKPPYNTYEDREKEREGGLERGDMEEKLMVPKDPYVFRDPYMYKDPYINGERESYGSRSFESQNSAPKAETPKPRARGLEQLHIRDSLCSDVYESPSASRASRDRYSKGALQSSTNLRYGGETENHFTKLTEDVYKAPRGSRSRSHEGLFADSYEDTDKRPRVQKHTYVPTSSLRNQTPSNNTRSSRSDLKEVMLSTGWGSMR